MKLIKIFILLLLLVSNSKSKVINPQIQDISKTEFVLSDSKPEKEDSEYDELDSLEAELDAIEENWNLYAAMKYCNKKIDRGIEETSGKGSLMQSISIGHTLGLTVGIDIRQSLGIPILYNDNNVYLDYVLPISENIELGVSYGKQSYSNEASSAMSGTNNSISIYSDIKLSSFFIDLSYDRYFGNNEYFNYYSTSILKSYYLNEDKSFKISPMLSLTFSSYTVDSTKILKKKVPLKPRKTITYQVTNFGLGSAVLSLKLAYKITPDLSFSFTPALNYIPKRGNDSSSLDFLAYFSIVYDLDF